MQRRLDRKTRVALARIVRGNVELYLTRSAAEGVGRNSPEGWCRELCEISAELLALVGAIAGPDEEKAFRTLLQGSEWSNHTHGEFLLDRAQDPGLNDAVVKAAERRMAAEVGAH